MKNLFEVYKRAVQFAKNNSALPADVPRVITFGFVHVGIPFASAQKLAEEIVSTNPRIEADEPHPLLMED